MLQQAEIDAQLQRILASPAFARSPRSTQFLLFCVRNGLDGNAIHLKETTIAIEVFDRAPDYDPKSDPIVRVHARRVREKLDLYYRTVGSADPIRIELPKGHYIPSVCRTLPTRKTDFSDWQPETPSAAPHDSHGTDQPRVQPSSQILVGSHVEASGAWGHLAVTDSSAADGRRLRSILSVACVGLLAAAIGFLLAWLVRDHPKLPAGPIIQLRPMDTLAGNLSDPAWSPDGKSLAFTASETLSGTPHVYLQTVGSSTLPVRLTQSEGPEMRPVWSPDGKEIAFIRSLDLSRFEIVRLRLSDGSQQSLGRFLTMPFVSEQHPALDWSPDGGSLLTTEQPTPTSPMRLVRVSLQTGERSALTSPPTGSTGDLEGKFSPDGRWIAFHRGGLGDLYVVTSNGEQSRPATRLTFDMKGVEGIAWCDRGRSILFGSHRGPADSSSVWKVPLEGGPPQRVSPRDFDASSPATTNDGTLLITHRQLAIAFVAHSLAGKTSDHAWISSDHLDAAPNFSPNGKSIAFLSDRSGEEELWVSQEDGTAPAQITRFGGTGRILFPAWSPDGTSIAFSFRQNAATNLFTYAFATKTLRQITNTRNRDISPVYSANGRYLYFSSNDDGTSRIWRIRTDGTEPEPLFWEGVAGFLPSTDGKWMYFAECGPGLSVVRRSLQDGATEVVFRSPGSPTFTRDLVSAHGLLYVGVSADNAARSEIFEIDPDRRTSRAVAHLSDLAPEWYSGFTLSPDGRTMIVAHTTRNDSSFYTAELAR